MPIPTAPDSIKRCQTEVFAAFGYIPGMLDGSVTNTERLMQYHERAKKITRRIAVRRKLVDLPAWQKFRNLAAASGARKGCRPRALTWDYDLVSQNEAGLPPQPVMWIWTRWALEMNEAFTSRQASPVLAAQILPMTAPRLAAAVCFPALLPIMAKQDEKPAGRRCRTRPLTRATAMHGR